MYFTTLNHYDDDVLYNLLNANDEKCIICWETNTHNEVQRMKQILVLSEFSKPCKCNGFFHYDCLLNWINKTNSCPICRSRLFTALEKKIQLQLQLNTNSQLFRILQFICKFNCLKFAKLCIYIFLIQYLYNIIYNIQNEIEGIYEDNNNICHL